MSDIVIFEAIKGRVSEISRAIEDRTPRRPEWVKRSFEEFNETRLLIEHIHFIPYTDEDEEAFIRLPARVKRHGSQDCRIAVQALRLGYTVITQNMRDFEPVGVKCEDWSVD